MTRPRPFVFAACCVGLFYGVMLHYRGFGWDGDSFVNAAQFVRLTTPRLHGHGCLDTHPKLGMILLFGLTYRLMGHFHLTTLLSMAVNAAAVGLLCRWGMRAEVLAAHVGARAYGSMSEAHRNGTGELQWRSLGEVADWVDKRFPNGAGRALVDRKKQAFSFLDVGSRVAGVDLLREGGLLRYADTQKYGVIVLGADTRESELRALPARGGDFRVARLDGRVVAIRVRLADRSAPLEPQAAIPAPSSR